MSLHLRRKFHFPLFCRMLTVRENTENARGKDPERHIFYRRKSGFGETLKEKLAIKYDRESLYTHESWGRRLKGCYMG